MPSNRDLERVNESHRLRGFGNLFRKENRAWWSTRRWWVNALLWTGMLGGLVGTILFLLPPLAVSTGDANVEAAGGPVAFGLAMGRAAFFELGTMALAIGVIVLCQDLIVEEKQSGVTEWLLAKPVARRAYVLAKLGASGLAMLLLLIVLPALVVFLLLSLRMGEVLPPLPFLGGLGIMTVHTLFYLSLTLMLGTLFTSRPPILGIALGILLGGNMLAGLLKPVLAVTPWMLAKIASLVAEPQTLPAGMLWPPVIATFLWSFAFVSAGLAKFEKTEF